MTSPPQIEILDLRHFNARQLRPILTQESVLWRERLRWDYATSTELLLQYLNLQILPGFVALLQGRVIGYCFCVYEGNKSVIGDVFVLPDVPCRLAITHTLMRHLLEVLEASPDIDRIEAQLLLYDVGVLAQPFLNAGFSIYPRLFLECELTERNLPQPDPAPLSIEICPWTPGYYQPTAELIHAAYLGHIDSKINDQYRTLHGSLRFLHNIVRFPGCGTFDPEASWVLRDRHARTLVGVVLCSRVAVGVAHVTQICITPELRGKAIGRLLLLHSMHRLRALGYSALTLTVSEENHSAVRLYLTSGFTVRLHFEALVLEKRTASSSARTHLGRPSDSLPAPVESSKKESVGYFGFSRTKPTPTRN